MAVPGLIAAMMVMVFLARRRPASAGRALVAAAALYAAYGFFYLTGGRSFSLPDVISHPWTWLPYTVMDVGGALAVLIGEGGVDDPTIGPSAQTQI
jgi:hypothetical protein